MPHISYSSYELLACLRRAQLQLAGLPQAPSPSRIVGIGVHAAVEADGLAWIATGQVLDRAARMRAAEQALVAEVALRDPLGFLSATVIADMEARSHACLDGYLTCQHDFPPLAVERRFELPWDYPIDGVTGEPWEFVGRLDRTATLCAGTRLILDGHPWIARGGERVIIDVKTSRPWTTRQASQHRQSEAYLLAEKLEGGPRSMAVVYVVLSPIPRDAGGYHCKVQLLATTRTDAQLESFAAALDATITQVLDLRARTEPAPARPPYPRFCAHCTLRGFCPEGQQRVEGAGIAPAVPLLTPDLAASLPLLQHTGDTP